MGHVHDGAMLDLKAGTADLHRHLEKRLAVGERFVQRERYVKHLAQLATFHLRAESDWADVLRPVLDDFPERCKAGLLLADLAHLGGEARGDAEVPPVACGAAGLGAFYVLEGATLGGQYLLATVTRVLGLDAAHGASYLASYGPAVRLMWERFGRQVDAHCRDRASIERAVAAARATFTALENHLCGAPA